MKEFVTVDVETLDLENAIIGVAELCAGLKREVLCYTESGILHADPNQAEPANALDFVQNYYELIQGSITLIQATSNLIATALANDDIGIAPGTRYKKN